LVNYFLSPGSFYSSLFYATAREAASASSYALVAASASSFALASAAAASASALA